MRRHRHRRRHYGRARRHTVPDRAEMISALGLEAEGSKRHQKYNFSTKEYWHKIRTHHSEAARKARRHFGLSEP